MPSRVPPPTSRPAKSCPAGIAAGATTLGLEYVFVFFVVLLLVLVFLLEPDEEEEDDVVTELVFDVPVFLPPPLRRTMDDSDRFERNGTSMALQCVG